MFFPAKALLAWAPPKVGIRTPRKTQSQRVRRCWRQRIGQQWPPAPEIPKNYDEFCNLGIKRGAVTRRVSHRMTMFSSHVQWFHKVLRLPDLNLMLETRQFGGEMWQYVTIFGQIYPNNMLLHRSNHQNILWISILVHVQHCSTPNLAFVLAHVNVSQSSSLFTKDEDLPKHACRISNPILGSTMHDYAWDSYHHKLERPGKEQLHQSNKHVWVALLQVRPFGHQARLDGKSLHYMDVWVGNYSNRTKWWTFQPTQETLVTMLQWTPPWNSTSLDCRKNIVGTRFAGSKLFKLNSASDSQAMSWHWA